MKKEFTYFIAFAVGAAVGSVASMKYFKTKYERIADAEIESVKHSIVHIIKTSDALNKKSDGNPKNNANSNSNSNSNDTKGEETMNKDDTKGKDTLNKIVNKLDYTSFSKSATEEEAKDEVELYEPEGDLPYIIPPEEVGENDYECQTYTLHSDGVVADEMGEEVDEEDLAYTIGSRDVFKHIDDYGTGAVYVRNDFLELDFEVIRSLDAYYDE